MSKRIAMTLQDWAYCAPVCDESNRMIREMRALLSVARAARSHSHAEVEPVADGDIESCRICRALAALDRAGGR